MSPPVTFEVTAQVGSGTAGSGGLEGLRDLALRLTEEMAGFWRQGERPTVEDFLDRYPELRTQPEAALSLVCEEICLREEYGLKDGEATVLERFLTLRTQVEQAMIAHRRQREDRAGPGFPSAGETWAECYLLTELGRGAMGRVFLATQTALANRPVVLKISTRDAREHLSLARLQHTHIVPLYAVHDDAPRHLRALCMPYFGGTTLGQILEALRPKPVATRRGEDVLAALDQFQARSPVAMPTKGPARTLLSRATYPQAICILGACLAEALKYAHERGLVHLDIKPDNVLLAADGQPMLLDFHLARAPLQAGGAMPEWFGGTYKYMSPEQTRATESVKARREDFPTVDGRSDIYALGLILYEALAGELPAESGTSPPRLEHVNAQVTTGLADIVHRCLAHDPEQRYADAGALSTDLNRYLADRPLLGVANRNLLERLRKWHRRDPRSLARMGMVCGLLLAALMGLNQARVQTNHRRQAAAESLTRAREQLSRSQYTEAQRTLDDGVRAVQAMWWGGNDLLERFHEQGQLTKRSHAAHTLRILIDRMRFVCAASRMAEAVARSLEQHCGALWDQRTLITTRIGEATPDSTVRTDLLDLAILWTELRVRLAPESGKPAARRDALHVLEEAEKLFGPSVVLEHERRRHAQALGLPEAKTRTDLAPRSAWEFFALGRSLLNAGELEAAARELDAAVAKRPEDFWFNFYQGTCAYQLKRYDKAAQAFCAAVALRPTSAECFHNRGLAFQQLGDTASALRDYDRAIQIDPHLGSAFLNRGILHLQQARYQAADDDLKRALSENADPADVHYHLAWLHHKQGQPSQALHHLGETRRRNHAGHWPHPEGHRTLTVLTSTFLHISSCRGPRQGV